MASNARDLIFVYYTTGYQKGFRYGVTLCQILSHQNPDDSWCHLQRHDAICCHGIANVSKY
jgi:hypothetical protein